MGEEKASQREELSFPGGDRQRVFTVSTRDFGTTVDLEPGQIVHGTFAGRVIGLRYDEGTTKKNEDGNPVLTPQWKKKAIIQAITVELDPWTVPAQEGPSNSSR